MRTGNFGAGWDFPMQNGRKLLRWNCLPLPVQVYICEAHQKKRSVCSGAYFVAGKMYLPGGGIVLRRKRVGTGRKTSKGNSAAEGIPAVCGC